MPIIPGNRGTLMQGALQERALEEDRKARKAAEKQALIGLGVGSALNVGGLLTDLYGIQQRRTGEKERLASEEKVAEDLRTAEENRFNTTRLHDYYMALLGAGLGANRDVATALSSSMLQDTNLSLDERIAEAGRVTGGLNAAVLGGLPGLSVGGAPQTAPAPPAPPEIKAQALIQAGREGTPRQDPLPAGGPAQQSPLTPGGSAQQSRLTPPGGPVDLSRLSRLLNTVGAREGVEPDKFPLVDQPTFLKLVARLSRQGLSTDEMRTVLGMLMRHTGGTVPEAGAIQRHTGSPDLVDLLLSRGGFPDPNVGVSHAGQVFRPEVLAFIEAIQSDVPIEEALTPEYQAAVAKQLDESAFARTLAGGGTALGEGAELLLGDLQRGVSGFLGQRLGQGIGQRIAGLFGAGGQGAPQAPALPGVPADTFVGPPAPNALDQPDAWSILANAQPPVQRSFAPPSPPASQRDFSLPSPPAPPLGPGGRSSGDEALLLEILGGGQAPENAEASALMSILTGEGGGLTESLAPPPRLGAPSPLPTPQLPPHSEMGLRNVPLGQPLRPLVPPGRLNSLEQLSPWLLFREGIDRLWDTLREADRRKKAGIGGF